MSLIAGEVISGPSTLGPAAASSLSPRGECLHCEEHRLRFPATATGGEAADDGGALGHHLLDYRLPDRQDTVGL